VGLLRNLLFRTFRPLPGTFMSQEAELACWPGASSGDCFERPLVI